MKLPVFCVTIFILFGCCLMNSSAQSPVIAEPRIYYHEEKLQGAPLESKVITLETFNLIVKHSASLRYHDMEKATPVKNGEKHESEALPMFKYATIRKDGIPYTDSERGSFYLPPAIIFHDVNDYLPYPAEFYFVAKIGDQLELCEGLGGEGIRWYQVADRYTSVTDPAIIRKTEETIAYLKGHAEKDFEQKKKARAEKLLPIGAEKKAAYTALTEMCLAQSSRKKEVLALINRLKEYDDGEEFVTTYDEFSMYMNKNNIPFIITVDWKESVEELEAWISAAAKENFKKTFRFDPRGQFNENSTVSDDGLFLAFDNQLRGLGLQIGMIETGGDFYQLVVHRTEDAKKIRAISGFRIFELTPEWQP